MFIYYDTRLTMGKRSSPGLFGKFAEAAKWVSIDNYSLSHTCHLLDQSLCIESQSRKREALNNMLHFFHKLRVLLAPN